MPIRCRVLSIAALCLLSATAGAYEVPSHWTELGTVAEWLHRDAQIWRHEGDAPFLTASQKNVDQRKVYAETSIYLGSMDAIGLPDFLALDQDAQRQRIGAARKHRDYVLRFRARMDTYVQQTRSEVPMSWGVDVADVMTVGECLKHLRSAVGMDPANPYAWHLYAMFCSIAGDTDRALGALAGADAALAEVPTRELADMRGAVALDRAWLLRNRGDLEGAATALMTAQEHAAPNLDSTLLRGLLAAQTGDIQTAVEHASRLRKVKIKRFMVPVTMGNHADNPGFWHPDRRNLETWKKEPSDYLQSWIMALAWLHEGQPDMAAKAFRKYSSKDVYSLSWRFWSDAGRIYEVTGRPELAAKAWIAARVWAPYAPYYPVKTYGADLSRLTGRGGLHPVYLAYDRFYIAGHRLVPGARLVDALNAEKDEMKRLELAGQATIELEACRDAGTYPAQASLLLGAVYHTMGDLQSAVVEVEEALETLEAEGDGPGYAAVLDELANVRADHSATQVQDFYGQSGAARSRWAATADAATERNALVAAHAADPSDGNRRALARYLVRHDEAEAGRDLVADTAADDAADMVLLLEAERALGESARAHELVVALQGGDDPYGDAEVWTMAGFVCLDAGLTDDAKLALERALELDPGNRALRLQMRLLE